MSDIFISFIFTLGAALIFVVLWVASKYRSLSELPDVEHDANEGANPDAND